MVNFGNQICNGIARNLATEFADTTESILKYGFRCTNKNSIASRLILVVSLIYHLCICITHSRSTESQSTSDSTRERTNEDRGEHITRCVSEVVDYLEYALVVGLHLRLCISCGSSGTAFRSLDHANNISCTRQSTVKTCGYGKEGFKECIVNILNDFACVSLIKSVIERFQKLVSFFLIAFSEVIVIDGNLVLLQKLISVISERIADICTVVGQGDASLNRIDIVHRKCDNVADFIRLAERSPISYRKPTLCLCICGVFNIRTDLRVFFKVFGVNSILLCLVNFIPLAVLVLGSE